MKHILIVDDTRTNLLAARDALAEDYRITALMSGQEALDFLEQEIPDLILLDIIMPHMDGFDVMKKLQENSKYADIPIIFLTADNKPETEIKCLENGGLDFISKPFVPMVMRSRISRTLELDELRKNLAYKLDEKIKEVSDIKSRSLKDSLTGLRNRAYTEEQIEAMLQNEVGGALLMMDLDNFKGINDRYGHIAGDHVLKVFAHVLKKYSSDEDIICRMGGDEFVTFLVGERTKEELGEFADHVIADMLKELEQFKFEIKVSVSVGIAQAYEDGNDFHTLYNAADKALYYVKQNGKNSYHFYSEEHEAEKERNSGRVDLRYIKDVLKRGDARLGSYQLNFDNFRHIYNFILRGMERNERDAQIVLFTLYSQEGKEDAMETEEAMESLEKAIFTSLRKVDVSSRYSSRQIMVILMDISEENSEMVAKRILKDFEKNYKGCLTFQYDTMCLEVEEMER